MATSGESGYFISLNNTLYFRWTAVQNIPLNQSTIQWHLDLESDINGAIDSTVERSYRIIVDNNEYSGTTTINIGANEVKVLASGETTVLHNAVGARQFDFYVRLQLFFPDLDVLYWDGETFELADVPQYPVITTASPFTDEGKPKFSYWNHMGDKVSSVQACLTLDGTNIDIGYREISKNSGVYEFPLTHNERLVLWKGCTTSTSRKIYYQVKTVTANGEEYYSRVESSYSIVNAEPTLSPVIADEWADSLALTGNGQAVISGFNQMYYETRGTTLKCASIVETKIVCGGMVANEPNGYLINATSNVFEFTITDSRGFTATKIITLSLIPYTRPTAQINVKNSDPTGTLTFNISGYYFYNTFGVVDNRSRAKLRYRYKDISGGFGSWVSVSGFNGDANTNRYSNDVAISGLDNKKTYVLEVWIADTISTATTDLGATATYTFSFIPVFDWSKEDFNLNVPLSMGGYQIMKRDSGRLIISPESNGAIVFRPKGINTPTNQIFINELGQLDGTGIMDQLHPVGSIYISVDSTSPAVLFGGNWERIKDTFLLASGSTYAAGAKGGSATHTLTEAQMPSHTHGVGWCDNDTIVSGNIFASLSNSYTSYIGWRDGGMSAKMYGQGTVQSKGSGSAHNNMPPYLAVYVWKRIPNESGEV